MATIIEEKARRYDEAKYIMKEYLESGNAGVIAENTIRKAFPELEEPEDERIKEELKKVLDECLNVRPQIVEETQYIRLIDWLEKQQKPADKIQLGKKYKCIASPRYSAFVKGEIYKPEDKFLCSLMNFCSDCFEPIEDGEQKPADKVKPKFKVGDWVIDKQDIVHQIANVIENVTYHTYGYDIVGGGYFNDNTEGVRLWTIQDAKDGDVLYMDNGLSTCTFIYKSIDNVIIQKYASYNKFGFEGTTYLVLNDGYVCPATKEQRDLLFQKMKDAGYEWDAEKKEVKKIEQKQDVSIQINPSDYINDMGGNGCYLKNTAQASAWSEEDEKYLNFIIATMKTLQVKCTENEIKRHSNSQAAPYYFKVINWLKSLKDRYTWFPSDEQMKQLGWIAKQNKDNMIGKELMTLYNDLKKLKEQSYESKQSTREDLCSYKR
jgi:hypothetical protein